jgi:hypothetical protein
MGQFRCLRPRRMLVSVGPRPSRFGNTGSRLAHAVHVVTVLASALLGAVTMLAATAARTMAARQSGQSGYRHVQCSLLWDLRGRGGRRRHASSWSVIRYMHRAKEEGALSPWRLPSQRCPGVWPRPGEMAAFDRHFAAGASSAACGFLPGIRLVCLRGAALTEPPTCRLLRTEVPPGLADVDTRTRGGGAHEHTDAREG